MKRLVVIFIVAYCSITMLSGQVDLQSWSALQLDVPLNPKLTFIAKPIVRHKTNLAEYNNSSIDFIFKYQINKKWGAAILQRHFFIRDGGDRQFLFFDLSHNTLAANKLKFKNTIRYHLALDHHRYDPDFIRYIPTLSYKLNDRLIPFVNLDFFIKSASPRSLAAIRYTVGSSFKLSNTLGLKLLYWRQAGYGDFPLAETHNIYTTLIYKLRKPSS